MVASKCNNRAAQYVRMSTDYQQYSTANQKAAIAAYAASHGVEIVVTYEDAGKSGLTISGRPALRQLIADVAAGQDTFDRILVYDISRWGRFQDADESAHLEYICRLGGVHVEYCAEPFPNDGSPFASICKVVKRALAAEYSRELSEKVYRGKRRLIELGFRQGGSPGIGLRRCLVDASGRRKCVLGKGERKSIASDRVILVPGPLREVRLVQRIYEDYVERGLGSTAIADALNQEGVRSESGRPWSKAVVKRILTSEKYVGDSVWSRSSFKLQIARQRNPRETWARFNGAFEPIVSRALFDQAQKVRARRSAKITDEQVISRLRAIYRKHGRITARLVKRSKFLSVLAIRNRFGSLITAYELAGYRPTRDLAFLAHNKAAQRLRAATAEEILIGLRSRGVQVERLSGACKFLVNQEIRISVTVAQQRRSQRGKPRWLVKPAMGTDDLRVAVLMDGNAERAHAYYFFPTAELTKECLLYPRNAADLEALRCSTLEPLFDLCARQELASVSLRAFPGEQSPSRHALPERPTRKARSRSQGCKTYLKAFSRASVYMRDAINRASAVSSRLDVLRQTLATVLMEPKLTSALVAEGIVSAPHAIYHPERHFEVAGERRYRARLREEALDLLKSGTLPRRTVAVLAKLNDPSRAEAAELIILANDPTAEYARALVTAAPASGLRDALRKPIYGADPQHQKRMRCEARRLLREGKPTFASFGRNALALVAVEAFARRLIEIRAVRAYLSRDDREAFLSL